MTRSFIQTSNMSISFVNTSDTSQLDLFETIVRVSTANLSQLHDPNKTLVLIAIQVVSSQSPTLVQVATKSWRKMICFIPYRHSTGFYA